MTTKRHILLVLGTRPEAIKLAPLIRVLRDDARVVTTTCVTAQHRELLDQALSAFGIRPDLDLDLMTADQDLGALTSRILGRVREVLDDVQPDIVVVQGDTTTAMTAALAAHYAQIPIAHVEAGLRTGSISDPWPEEANRRIIARLAALHFAPTETARANLLSEGVDSATVHVTGNTSIDAINLVEPVDPEFEPGTVLVTCHRRENQRDDYTSVANVLRTLATTFPERRFVFPLHPGPRVAEPMKRKLGDLPNLELILPLDYPLMLGAIRSADVVVTDSGGVQEEAAHFGTPCLVIRPRTDRPESAESGAARVVGHDAQAAIAGIRWADDVRDNLRRKTPVTFGDGHAAARIADVLIDWQPDICP